MTTRRKIVIFLLSVLAAVLLWLYVVTVVAPEATFPISGIPISIDGSLVLEERNLIITAMDVDTVSLELRTARSNLSKLNAENIRVTADASRLKEPGEYTLSCSVDFPDTVRDSDVEILRKRPETVHITLTRIKNKTLTIQPVWNGDVKEGFVLETNRVTCDPEKVEITGPEEEIDKVVKAVATADISNMEETSIVTVPVILLDENDEEISFSDLTTVVGSQVNMTLPVLKTRELNLALDIKEGGGVMEKNTEITLEPSTIWVKGAADVIDALDDPLIIGELDLSTIADYDEDEKIYPLELPVGVTNISGVDEIKAQIRVSGVKTDAVSVSDIRLENAPQGLKTEIPTKTVRVPIRGSTAQILEIKNNSDNGIYILVDLSAYNQTGAFSVTGKVINPKYPDVSTAETVEIGVLISIPDPAGTNETTEG